MSVKQQCKCKNETEKDKYAKIGEFINDVGNKEGSLIQVLHFAQGVFGYLPIDLQQFISEKMKIPLSEVSGVVTFYSFFSTQKQGEYTISVCLGTACYVRGGKKIVSKLKEILDVDVGETTSDEKFTLKVMRCVGACGLAPVITINGKVFKQVSPEKLQSIIEKYN